VQRVLVAETAVFVGLQPVRVGFLLFHRIIIPLLAFRAGQRDFRPHF
jgi:hypothetical protein